MRQIPFILGSLIVIAILAIIVYSDVEISDEKRKEVLNCTEFSQKQVDIILDLTRDGAFSNKDYDYLYRIGIVDFAKQHKQKDK